MLFSGSRQTIVCTGNAGQHLTAHAPSKVGCCNLVEMMDRDVENAYAVETPFRCQVQKLVSCIFELLLNSWFSEAGRGEEVHQNFEAHTTERAEGFNFSGVVERWTIDELRKALRKAHVDGQEDEMLSRLGESTPFVFGLIAASNIDELLPLYRSLQEHLRSGFDEIMYDAASAGEGQSSSASSMMDLSDEDDTSMLDEDEDQTAPHRDSGCESDHDMDCDSCEIGERPESEDQCLERELTNMTMCDGEP